MKGQPSHATMPVKYKTSSPLLLDCPECHHFIASEHINIEKDIVQCPNCNHRFSLHDTIENDAIRREEIVMPKGVDVLRLNSLLDIIVDWYHATPKRTISTIISGSFLWNIILIPIVISLALAGDFFFIIFFGGHLMTGLVLISYLVAIFLNKTHIEVDKSGIRIQHRPIPLFNKSQKIPIQDIAQLYVSRYTERFNKKKGKGVQAYALSAVLTNNQVVELVKGLDRDTQLYLEQEIETYLGIIDKRVDGEVSRK